MVNVFPVLALLSFLGLMLPEMTLAQEGPEAPQYEIEDIEVSYIYAALMGTGSYKIDGRRITMLRLPFSFTQKRASETEHGFKWYLPVVIGHDSVKGSDWFEELIPDELITLTALPGFEYQYPISPDWMIKPFGHLGYTHDFVTDENVIMWVLGISSVNRFYMDEAKDWELRWGNKVRFAAEHQLKSERDSSFGIIETGVDIRRKTGWLFMGREVDMGAYYRFQHFVPEWDISDAPDRHSEVANLHELGMSVGLKKSRKIFGITFQRVRLGYKYGDDLRGFTIGGEFPF